MSARELIDDRALEDEDEDEDFDQDTGEVTRKSNGHTGSRGNFDDSSEEDEDDDDEEAAAEVARGFIVDEEEEDEETRAERRREKKKRKREEREREEENLDEEDLELIGLKAPNETQESKFKRLKRGPREEANAQTAAGVNDIFRDSEDEELDQRPVRQDRRGYQDEFDDFIEEDVFSDEEGRDGRDDEEVARPNRSRRQDLGIAQDAGLDEAALEDFRAAFGDGTDYDFALDAEDDADEADAAKDKELNLKDVFEPSQLAERMLTDEDNEIRFYDQPERFQIARKLYRNVEISGAAFNEESGWISKLLLPRANLPSNMHEPYRRAVAKVLEFMIKDDFEVPFIFQNRKDYLIHAERKNVGKDDDGEVRYEIEASKLLQQTDLWDIFEFDLKFRAFVDKRTSLEVTYNGLKDHVGISDSTFDSMIREAETMEELQDLQDYLYFQYAAQLKDLAAASNGEVNGFGMSRKKAATETTFEKVRAGRIYGLVRAYGISANDFAQNALMQGGAKSYTEDPVDKPDDMADTFIGPEFATGTQAMKAARATFIEELVTNPNMRKVVRMSLYQAGVIDCMRTEKGLRKIDEQHPYYDFKYLRNQDFQAIARDPEQYLKMLQAEEEGLIDLRIRLQNRDTLRKQLYRHIESDNLSDVAGAWNRERRDVVDAALSKILAILVKAAKENIKNECENRVARDCRDEFTRRLDQAPYQPKGMKKGTIPRVLAMSNGAGVHNRDAICWAWVGEDGRVLENGKFVDLAPGDRERGFPDGADVAAFVDLVRRREPDVIGISGFSPETRKLYNHLTAVAKEKDLRGAIYNDPEDDRDTSDLLDVVIVNDEIARLYQSSDRAKMDHPGFAPLTNYCVALAKYMQDPLKEYAALGRDLVSISFVPGQQLLPQDRMLKVLETVLVDYVNMCGVDLNEAVVDSALANLLPYVAGLGPRKAAQLLKVINLNGGIVATREELIVTEDKQVAMGVKVWNNCASTLFLDYDPTEPTSEYLDNTRIHPEDYDIARKMAADALELDEEDIKAETDENGTGAIVRKLVKDEAQERVNDLILEEYAEQLERNLNQRKRATLENIRAELNEPYEELRQPFMTSLASDDVFTMLTGETRDTLERGMVVPISLKRISDDHIDGKLDCGIDAYIAPDEFTDRYDVAVKDLYSMHQTVQGRILSLDRKHFTANCSLRDEETKKPYRRHHDREYDEWDDREEAADKKLLEEKTDAGGRATRVIKHPLFRAFNSAQAEEYLGSQNRGDVIIRPSSKGSDHLAVTWKVADGVYQHIDVLEMDKENEFALGKTLKIAGRYTYSDLDELIVLHVKAMAKKVDELIGHEKFQRGSKADIGKSHLDHATRCLAANVFPRTMVDHVH